MESKFCESFSLFLFHPLKFFQIYINKPIPQLSTLYSFQPLTFSNIIFTPLFPPNYKDIYNSPPLSLPSLFLLPKIHHLRIILLHRDLCMTMFPFISYNQHRWIIHSPLHVFPCGTSTEDATLIVTPDHPKKKY